MDKKLLRNDLIVIGSLLLVTIITLVCVFVFRTKKNLVAKIHVKNEVVETIDLSKKEEKDYLVKGINGYVHVHTHDGAIAITESNCPHQDCVKMGYIHESGRPIICAYNGVYITIDGSSSINDVEI